VLGDRQRLGANLVIRLDSARMLSAAQEPSRVLLAWEGHSDDAPRGMVGELGEGYAPGGPVQRLSAAYDNFSGETARLSYQVFQRAP